MRRSLYDAASVLLKRFRGRDKVKTWGLQIAKRSCHHKAAVAVARKLAVIMHAMWCDGTFYAGDAQATPEELARRSKHNEQEHLGRHAKVVATRRDAAAATAAPAAPSVTPAHTGAHARTHP